MAHPAVPSPDMADVLTSESPPQTARWARQGPPPPVRWVRRHPQAADTLLAVVLTIGAIGALAGHGHPTYEVTPLLVLLAVASALPLSVRRHAPMLVLLVVATAQVGLELAGADGPGWLAAMFAGYTVASRSPNVTPRRILIGVGLAAIPVTAAAIVADVNPAVFIPSAVVITLVMIVGDRVRRGREMGRAIAVQAAEQQRHEADQALQDERRRIARELHDVVAHSVSAMVIQAAAARRQLTVNPDQASQALLEVEATGRTAMHEMRRVLGVLRGDEPAPALGPQPSLSAIDDLVEAASDLPIRFTCAPQDELADVPAAVGLSAYRVVQEALTNVRRHAGVVRAVEVNVRREPRQLVVEIADDGRGASVSAGPAGFGLIGMRERVGMFDGTLVAGPRPGGGWRVRATLPMDGLS